MVVAVQTTTVPWVKKEIAGRGKNPPRVEFHFSPDYIRALLEPAGAVTKTTRASDDASEGERMLLSDVVSVEGLSLFVTAWLVPATRYEYYHIRVEVMATPRLTRHGRVNLQWDKYKYTVPLAAGEMLFEDISPPDFSRLKGNLPSPRLSMSFEFDDHRKNGKH